MPSATSALYEPLIERDLDAIAPAAHAFLERHSEEELWVAVARFAVLAYAPAQHAKRAVMAARAAQDMRSVELTIACARYAAESRLPWSEPPIFEGGELPSYDALRTNARGDALLMLDAAQALERTLGEKGRAALVRMVTCELESPSEHPTESLEVLVDRAIGSNGAIDDVRSVFVAAVGLPPLREAVPL
ncbi:MAG TPA: hypothetical protein VE010_21805, partial [Thermoanaerobaculia bacterium]|nr:hypothetical protein [Thermoanaerobaculia bacterium]